MTSNEVISNEKAEAERGDEGIWGEHMYADNSFYNYKYWDLLNQKHIISFICNYLLFLNDPRTHLIVHKGKTKKFKKDTYIFNHPKSVSTVLTNEVQRYVDNYKSIPTGTKFIYKYKFPVRGHFRELRNKKYKVHKKIWIPPFFRGHGPFIKKNFVLK